MVKLQHLLDIYMRNDFELWGSPSFMIPCELHGTFWVVSACLVGCLLLLAWISETYLWSHL